MFTTYNLVSLISNVLFKSLPTKIYFDKSLFFVTPISPILVQQPGYKFIVAK